MSDIKEKIKALIALQEKDNSLDRLRAMAKSIPLLIEEKNNLILNLRKDAEDLKKGLMQVQVQRKGKEIELETKENEIKKHSMELNSIKSNEAYKALLSEIDFCKKAKTEIENDILDLMEKADNENKVLKSKDNELKLKESEIKQEISRVENELKDLNAQIMSSENERSEYAKIIDSDLLKQYDYIRESKQGLAVANIEVDSCSGCHIVLRPQVINDVIKERDLIFCDACSRILYKK